MLRIRCSCNGFLESSHWIEQTDEVLFVCWKCGRVEFYHRKELSNLIDLDATLEYELHKAEVRNLAVFGVHYRFNGK